VGIAWELLKALPNARLAVAEDAGHSGPSQGPLIEAAMDRLLAG
jgi:hypothetical protein